MYRISLAIVLVAAFLTGSLSAEGPQTIPIPESRKPARDDLAKLQGVWVRVAMEAEGRQSALDGAAWTATYEGDQLILRNGGEHYRRSIVTLDPGRTPKAMNTWDQDGPAKDKTYPGIYAFEGDTLRLCFSRPGKERPTEFGSTQGSGFLSFTYKRQRP